MNQWKAIKSAKNKPFELYDLNQDIEEQVNVADLHPEILAEMEAFAEAAHEEPRHGRVFDHVVGFKG